LTASWVGYGREYELAPVFKKMDASLGRLGSGPRLVADRADVVQANLQGRSIDPVRRSTESIVFIDTGNGTFGNLVVYTGLS